MPSRFLITLLLLLGFANEAAAQDKKYALLVGVKRYGNAPFVDLPSAEQDALALERALKDLGFRTVVTMTSIAPLPTRRPASAKNILDQLDGLLSGKEADDTIVVFLSATTAASMGPQPGWLPLPAFA